MRFENNLNKRERSLEYLNRLESKYKGIENMLYKNVISDISKKIDNIEKKFADELKNKELKKINSSKTKSIESLNMNIDEIEFDLGKSLISQDVSTSELISKKIEENYKLLDELEKSNKPIFSIRPESHYRVFVEDKIKEMDDKLGTLFTAYREKNKNNEFSDTTYTWQYENDINGESIYGYSTNSTETPAINTLTEKQKREKEKEELLKELHNKLTSTEKKIKEIAGTILKNF